MTQLFLPENYKERLNPAQYFDMGMKDEWQKEVYEKAAEIFIKNKYETVVDLGCGSAYKLLNYFPKTAILTGVEERLTYAWLVANYPDNNWIEYDPNLVLSPQDLLVCADVIEHIIDVISFVDWLNSQDWKTAVISTPDRILLYGTEHMGPPPNGAHVREWSFDEFHSFMSQWFTIKEHLITSTGQGAQTMIIEKR